MDPVLIHEIDLKIDSKLKLLTSWLGMCKSQGVTQTRQLIEFACECIEVYGNFCIVLGPYHPNQTSLQLETCTVVTNSW